MALLHRAQLNPSKLELISAWAPTQPWFGGEVTAAITSVASYRFDDPDGEVGIETIIVRVGDGELLQVPLTYRASPLSVAADWLIGTTEHSVLGRRWVYDATGDPVYVETTAVAAFTGGIQAEEYFEVDGQRVARDSSAHVHGSGHPGDAVPSSVGAISIHHKDGTTVIESGDLRMVVSRALETAKAPDGAQKTLTGTWSDRSEAQPLVWVSALR